MRPAQVVDSSAEHGHGFIVDCAALCRQFDQWQYLEKLSILQFVILSKYTILYYLAARLAHYNLSVSKSLARYLHGILIGDFVAKTCVKY